MIYFILDESGTGMRCVLAGHFDTLACAELTAALRDRLAALAGPLKDAPSDATDARLVGLLTAALPEGFRIVFDMARVAYVSSMFLRVCQIVARGLSPCAFSMTNTTPPIKKIFKIAGLDLLLQVG